LSKIFLGILTENNLLHDAIPKAKLSKYFSASSGVSERSYNIKYSSEEIDVNELLDKSIGSTPLLSNSLFFSLSSRFISK